MWQEHIALKLKHLFYHSEFANYIPDNLDGTKSSLVFDEKLNDGDVKLNDRDEKRNDGMVIYFTKSS